MNEAVTHPSTDAEKKNKKTIWWLECQASNFKGPFYKVPRDPPVIRGNRNDSHKSLSSIC